jgi:hypothetical protein
VLTAEEYPVHTRRAPHSGAASLCLWFAIVALGTPRSVGGQQLRGDPDAIALARVMIGRMGDPALWASASTLHVIEEVHRPDVRTPYRSETWRSLVEPRIWYRGRPGGTERTFARTPDGGWDLRGGVLRRSSNLELRRWLGYWPRNVYVMYHRLAREDSTLWLVKTSERRFAVLDAGSDEKLCEFEVTAAGELLRWSASFGLETEEWIYGPLVDFGPIRMPAWGTRLQDGYRFYYRAVTLSDSTPPVSYDPPW